MNEVSIAVKLSNFPFTLDDITSKLDLLPTHCHLQGETYEVKSVEGIIEKKYAYNYWEYRYEFKGEEWAQTLADKFIEDVILVKKETFKELSAKCEIEFFIGVNYYNEVNPGFHFDLAKMKLLSYIGAELDIDLYTLK